MSLVDSSRLGYLLVFTVCDCSGKTDLIFDLSPRQLSDSELHQHVKQWPQVIMATHFLEGHTMNTSVQHGRRPERPHPWEHQCIETHLVFMSVDWSVPDRPSEARHGPRLNTTWVTKLFSGWNSQRLVLIHLILLRPQTPHWSQAVTPD